VIHRESFSASRRENSGTRYRDLFVAESRESFRPRIATVPRVHRAASTLIMSEKHLGATTFEVIGTAAARVLARIAPPKRGPAALVTRPAQALGKTPGSNRRGAARANGTADD
jgi:hypothetical protein